MIIGAHPDDCEHSAGGLAALAARRGWQVRFVAVTSGNAGHQNMKPKALAARRLKEAKRAVGRIGASYRNLGEPDGRLFVTDSTTRKVVGTIREFAPDVLVCPRTCDYHRDHRHTAQLVLDASFILKVPLAYPEFQAMHEVPVILYSCDFFTEGPPFHADLPVDIGPVREVYLQMLMDHESQFFEWIPWVDGRHEVTLKNPLTDRKAVSEFLLRHSRRAAEKYAGALRKKYGRKVLNAEAYQISEYGRRVSPKELAAIFSF